MASSQPSVCSRLFEQGPQDFAPVHGAHCCFLTERPCVEAEKKGPGYISTPSPNVNPLLVDGSWRGRTIRFAHVHLFSCPSVSGGECHALHKVGPGGECAWAGRFSGRGLRR